MNNARLVLAVIRLSAMADAPFNDPVYTGMTPRQYANSKARLLTYKATNSAA